MLIPVLFLLQSLLFMGLSVPLIQGRVKPNPYYGLRTRKSLSNPDIWYRSNRICGRAIFAAGAANAVLCLVVLALGSRLTPHAQAWLIVLGGMHLSVLSATIVWLRALARM